MMSDKELEYLIQEVTDIYSEMELELIVSVCKRLATYKTIDGTLNWYLKKLSELKVLNKDLLKIISKYSGIAEDSIKKRFKEAILGNVDREYLNEAFEEGVSKISFEQLQESPAINRTLQSQIYDLSETLSMINTKALESARDGYIRTLNRLYIEVASGTYGLGEAMEKNVKAMAEKGFSAATYESGVKVSIEAVVRRDVISAVGSLVNEGMIESAKEAGTNYVEVSQHLGARVSKRSKWANHAGWQGKVYQIEGSSSKYKNLYEETGYGNIEGLGGVNCRHRLFLFFPGITKPKEPVDKKRNKKVYEASQQLRALERAWRKWKREREAKKTIGADHKKEDKKCKEYSDKIDEILDKFPELRSAGSRKMIKEELK